MPASAGMLLGVDCSIHQPSHQRGAHGDMERPMPKKRHIEHQGGHYGPENAAKKDGQAVIPAHHALLANLAQLRDLEAGWSVLVMANYRSLWVQ